MNKISNDEVEKILQDDYKYLQTLFPQDQIFGIFTYGDFNYGFAETIKDLKGSAITNYYIIPPIIHFIDGKSNCSMSLTKDYRFVYGFYYNQITMFRVTNISPKPIEWRERKIEQYKKIQEKIDELKNQQRRLLTENI